MEFRVLELFSGIGGMHSAFEYAQLQGEIVTAIDINTVANIVYKHNHPNTALLNKNIQSLNAKLVDKLDVNMLLLSPPCQPHTRVGHQRDLADSRSDALNHLCELLPKCTGLRYVLMENVKGFEKSQARQRFIESLQSAGFHWREFILSPTQFGVPNTRHRYYCVARKNLPFPFDGTQIWEKLPPPHCPCETTSVRLCDLLEAEVSNELLPDKVLNRHVWLLDIVTSESNNTMCFTKAYTHYSEGTGSVYTPLTSAAMQISCIAQIKALENGDQALEGCKRLELLRSLYLRYFTPHEVAKLMSFPTTFNFPPSITQRQRYRLLGNSINVRVVGELLKLLTAGVAKQSMCLRASS